MEGREREGVWGVGEKEGSSEREGRLRGEEGMVEEEGHTGTCLSPL